MQKTDNPSFLHAPELVATIYLLKTCNRRKFPWVNIITSCSKIFRQQKKYFNAKYLILLTCKYKCKNFVSKFAPKSFCCKLLCGCHSMVSNTLSIVFCLGASFNAVRLISPKYIIVNNRNLYLLNWNCNLFNLSVSLSGLPYQYYTHSDAVFLPFKFWLQEKKIPN